MEFVSGFVVGSVVTVIAQFAYKFYTRTEEKDKLLAQETGKDFEEKIRLVSKQKSA